MLVLARLRMEMEATLKDIRNAFKNTSGELRKVICFVWDILPGQEAALDVEMYEYDRESCREKLAQRVVSIPRELGK